VLPGLLFSVMEPSEICGIPLYCFALSHTQKKDKVIFDNICHLGCSHTQKSAAVHFLANTFSPFLLLQVVYNY